MDWLMKGTLKSEVQVGPVVGPGQAGRRGIGTSAVQSAQRNVGRERILDRELRRSRTAVIERGAYGIALLDGVNEAIGADAVIEHSRTTADHQFAVHLVGKS